MKLKYWEICKYMAEGKIKKGITIQDSITFKTYKFNGFNFINIKNGDYLYTIINDIDLYKREFYMINIELNDICKYMIKLNDKDYIVIKDIKKRY